jgi:hypothetical protein
MSAQDASGTYLEQMTTLFNTFSSYMRLPVLITSVLSFLAPVHLDGSQMTLYLS